MKKLEFWGGLLTVIYLSFMGWWVYRSRNEFMVLTPNELGDFLAGTFGPVAFLWLVLGFLQQGRELKLSTDALQMQAEELKNSVTQQSIMANAAVNQIDAARKALEFQMEEADRSVRADFEVGASLRMGANSGKVTNKLRITNNRNVAYKVMCEFSGDLPFCKSIDLGTLKAGDYSEEQFVFDYEHPGTGTLKVFYEDICGKDRVVVFDVWINDGWIKNLKRRGMSTTIEMPNESC